MDRRLLCTLILLSLPAAAPAAPSDWAREETRAQRVLDDSDWSAAHASRPFQLFGLRLGDHLRDRPAGEACPYNDPRGEDEHCVLLDHRVGEANVDAALRFINGRLAVVVAQFDPQEYPVIKELLTERHGRPEVRARTIRNAKGKKLKDEMSRWELAEGVLTLSRYGRDLRRGRLAIIADWARDNIEQLDRPEVTLPPPERYDSYYRSSDDWYFDRLMELEEQRLVESDIYEERIWRLEREVDEAREDAWEARQQAWESRRHTYHADFYYSYPGYYVPPAYTLLPRPRPHHDHHHGQGSRPPRPSDSRPPESRPPESRPPQRPEQRSDSPYGAAHAQSEAELKRRLEQERREQQQREEQQRHENENAEQRRTEQRRQQESDLRRQMEEQRREQQAQEATRRETEQRRQEEEARRRQESDLRRQMEEQRREQQAQEAARRESEQRRQQEEARRHQEDELRRQMEAQRRQQAENERRQQQAENERRQQEAARRQQEELQRQMENQRRQQEQQAAGLRKQQEEAAAREREAQRRAKEEAERRAREEAARQQQNSSPGGSFGGRR